jgi:hypothetical protein
MNALQATGFSVRPWPGGVASISKAWLPAILSGVLLVFSVTRCDAGTSASLRNGMLTFDKYFTGQLGKEGLIVDERFNHGGRSPDFYTEKLGRRILLALAPREGKEFVPQTASFGPKVMIVNEQAGWRSVPVLLQEGEARTAGRNTHMGRLLQGAAAKSRRPGMTLPNQSLNSESRL